VGKTRIIAHRGFSQKFPENTIVAFQKAVEYGADSVEFGSELLFDKIVTLRQKFKQ